MISAIQRSRNIVESWLSLHVPHESLCQLEKSVRQQIGKRRPRSTYDLLPCDLKSSSFVIQFDMETPRNRFVILHRSVISEFYELSANDKQELMEVCLKFVNRFKFKGSYLSVPLGDNNHANEVYPTFHAYLVISSKQSFLELFRRKSHERVIPEWPETDRWVTPLWLPDSYPPRDANCFEESLDYNSTLFPDETKSLLSSKGVLLPSSRGDCYLEEEKKFYMINWPAMKIVGFKSHKMKENQYSIVDLCEHLNYMYDTVQPVLSEKPDMCCYMIISLSGVFRLGHDENVIAFLKFNPHVPSVFDRMSKFSLTHDKNDFWRKIPSPPPDFVFDYVEVISSPGDIYDHWVIIESNGSSWISNEL